MLIRTRSYADNRFHGRGVPAGVAAACVLLTVVLLGQQRLELPGCLPKAAYPGIKGVGSTPIKQGTPRDGAAAAAGSATSDGRRKCTPAVTPSPWEDSCKLLTDACVDQNTVILYGGGTEGMAPYELVPGPEQRKYIFFMHRNSSLRDYRYSPPPLRVRPASTNEGAPYLESPVFSSCTVPVVWYSQWISNLGHFYRDNAAKIYSVLRDTPWAQHAKFVLMTAEGHAAPGFAYDILQPLTPLQVETWADFSARLPSQQAADGSGYVPIDWRASGTAAATGSGDAPPRRLSYEGGPQRCFKHMLVCNRGINITSWPLHELGQRLVQHYQSKELVPAQHQLAAAAGEGAEATPRGSNGDGSSGGSSSGSEQVVRVTFHKRTTPDRQLLNTAELLERCNRWRYRAPGGRAVRFQCWEVEPTNVFTGMAAAQAADIFVGAHGANLANSWFMRPGSSVIELQPFGFDTFPAHLQFPIFNMEDSGSSLLWWVISICDPQGWTPGHDEAAGSGLPASWPKLRNLIVRWEALKVALQAAVDAGGDVQQYRRRFKDGGWWWFMGRNGSMTDAGRAHSKKRCPAD